MWMVHVYGNGVNMLFRACPKLEAQVEVPFWIVPSHIVSTVQGLAAETVGSRLDVTFCPQLEAITGRGPEASVLCVSSILCVFPPQEATQCLSIITIMFDQCDFCQLLKEPYSCTATLKYQGETDNTEP